MERNQLRRVRFAVGVSFAVESLNKLYPLLIIHVIQSRIGMAGFGMAQLGISAVELLTPLIIFGTTYDAAIRWGRSGGDRALGAEIFSTSLAIRAPIALAAVTILAVFCFASSAGSAYRPFFWALSFTLLPAVSDATWIFIGGRRTATWGLWLLAAKTLSFGAMWLWIQGPSGAPLYATLSVLGNAAVAAVSAIYALRTFGWQAPTREGIRRNLGGSWRVAAVIGGGMIFARLDIFTVNALFGPEATGLYAGPARMNTSLFLFLSALGIVFFSEQTAATTKAEVQQIYRLAGHVVAFALAPLVIGVWLVDHELVTLVVGPDFAAGASILSLLMVSNLGAAGMALFGDQILLTRRRHGAILVALGAGFIAFGAALGVGIATGAGLTAVATAVIAGKLTTAVGMAWVARAYLESFLGRQLLLYGVLAAVAVGIPVALGATHFAAIIGGAAAGYLALTGSLQRQGLRALLRRQPPAHEAGELASSERR